MSQPLGLVINRGVKVLVTPIKRGLWARTSGARLLHWRKETAHETLFALEPRESHLKAVIQQTLSQAQILERGGLPAQTTLAMRVFGQYVADRRRDRGWTRRQAAQHTMLSDHQIADLEWGLLGSDVVQRLWDDIATICGVPVSDLTQVLQACVSSLTERSSQDPSPPQGDLKS